MKIEKSNVEDLETILTLQYLAYQSEAKLLNNPNIPPLKQTLDEVNQEFQEGLILKAVGDDGSIIGSVRAREKDGTVYIGKLIVHPDFQGHGIGTKLLLAVEKEYPDRRYELFTSTMSKRNIALYQRLNYQMFDERKISDTLNFVYLEKQIRQTD